MKGLPVLMYHSIGGPLSQRYAHLVVAAGLLHEQLDHLQRSGYALAGLTDAVAAHARGERVVAVTFDDGYLDFAEQAVPVLAALHAGATLYVPSRDLGGTSAWLGSGDEVALLSAQAVADLAADGWEVGSHGARHVPLDVLTDAEQRAEVHESREVLGEVTGRPIASFCYPHGYHSRRLRAAVAAAGFCNACAIGHRVSPDGEDPFAISRLMVGPDHDAEQVLRMAEGVRQLATYRQAGRHAGLASGPDDGLAHRRGPVDMNLARPLPDPQTDPSVGVVVCTHLHDRLDQLAAALDSLDQQTRPADQVVVMVDGSPLLAEQVRARLPGATVWCLGENKGVSVARTEAARRLRTDVVAFLDDDAIADRRWLEILVGTLRGPKVLGASGRSDALFSGTRPRWLPDEFLWVVGCSYRGMPTEPARVRNVFGGCAVVWREMFLEVGGYHGDVGHRGDRVGGGEEADFCLRATQATGGTFVFDPSAFIRHRVPAQRLTWSYYIERCRTEGRMKARMADLASERGSLGPEREFALRLPMAALRALMRPGERARVVGLIVGVLAVLLGLAEGRLRR